jgi:PhnB protein
MTDIPRAPSQGVIPHLNVKGAKKAIEFYKRAFGAEEVFAAPADDGERLLHAQLSINNGGVLMLHDDFPEYRGGAAEPPPAGVVLHLQVDDSDTWFERAVKAGASVVMPIGDQFWGDRYGQIKDPFGHLWSIGSPIKK